MRRFVLLGVLPTVILAALGAGVFFCARLRCYLPGRAAFERRAVDILLPARSACRRVSLALIKAGIRYWRLQRQRPHGDTQGAFKGTLIEPGQARLAHMLTRAALLDAPEKLGRQTAIAGIGQRLALVAFLRIPGFLGGAGGHIDIVLPSAGVKACGSECYWRCAEAWLRELR